MTQGFTGEPVPWCMVLQEGIPAQEQMTEKTQIETIGNETRYRGPGDDSYPLDEKKLRRMRKMEQALQYMLDHLKEECRLEDAARAAGYGEEYFRKVFREYFEMPFDRLLSHLRLREAARDIQQENYPKGLWKRYFFSGPQSFSRAFSRVIGINPSKYRKGNHIAPDLPAREKVMGLEIHLEYRVVHAIRMKGIPMRLPEGNDTLLMEKVSFAFTPEGLAQQEGALEDAIGIWWHDPQERLRYLYGSVTREYGMAAAPEEIVRESGEGETELIIQGGNYAVFSYPRPEEEGRIPLLSRILCRYVFKEWVPMNHKEVDTMGFTYERFTGDRVYLYLPLQVGMEGSSHLRETKWGVAEWADYIDSHILEPLTTESLARIAGYSPSNYRDVFLMYYNISPATYILRRRLYLASSQMREEKCDRDEILRRYGFSSWDRFQGLFSQEFPGEPVLGELEEVHLPDLIRFYQRNRERVVTAIRQCRPIRAVMHEIRQTSEKELPRDIQSLVLYWFQTEQEEFRNLRPFLSGTNSRRQKLFIWDSEPIREGDYLVYRYYVGSILRRDAAEEDLARRLEGREGIHVEHVPGGKYMVFTTLDIQDMENPMEAFHLLIRCSFGGWIHDNRYRVDMNRRTFFIWRKQKLFFYVPVIN